MNDPSPPRWGGEIRDADFVRKVLLAIGLVAFAYLLYSLADVLILAFGAVLFAVMLRAFAEVLARYTPIPKRWSLAAAALILLGIVLGIGLLFGAQIRGQLANVAERLPEAVNTFTNGLGLGEITSRMPDMLRDPGSGFVGRLATLGTAALGGLANIVLVVVAGLYIAGSPHHYRVGLVKLFPPNQHARIEGALDASGKALKLWLGAQLIAMACVALLTTAALWLLGVPSALALGLIAGVTDFIPFVGPIIGALPAVLLAFSVDANTALWTVLAFVAIQQIEANVIFPIVQRHAVEFPPALALFAIVAAGVLFGSLGLVFGFPLALVAFVLVKKLYVKETLGEETPVPGESDRTSAASG